MNQSSIDKTRIDNLERFVFKSTSVSTTSLKIPYPPNKQSKPMQYELVAVLPKNYLTPIDDETFSR
jgi:hypothetical protein